MKDPKTLLDVPPSVAFEPLVPLNPFSTSSIQRQQGAMASAVWMTARRLDSDFRVDQAIHRAPEEQVVFEFLGDLFDFGFHPRFLGRYQIRPWVSGSDVVDDFGFHWFVFLV
jgi:hypothetical protein